MLGSVSRTLALTGLALQTGTSLKHNHEKLVPVDALHALGRTSNPIGAALVHFRLSAENDAAMLAIVEELTQDIFAHCGWSIPERRLHARAHTLHLFAKQVLREFLLEFCPHCHGHGVVGQQYDVVARVRARCGACKGIGYATRPNCDASGTVRHLCRRCIGTGQTELTEERKAGRVKTCQACAATGVVRDSTRSRARAMDFDHAHILRVWGVRFNTVLADLRKTFWMTIDEATKLLG